MIGIKNNITAFLSTNATNPTTLYDPLVSYSVGDNRRYENYVYKSTQDSNLGNLPIETLNYSWVEWNPANDYAMLDYFRDTVTQFPSDSDGVVIFERGSNDTLLIGGFNSTTITIEYLDVSNNVIDANDTETYLFTSFNNMYNPYLYIYGGFEYDTTQIIYQRIKRIGVNVRVTFSRNLHNNECGFLFAGTSVDFGVTLDGVAFDNIDYGNTTSREASLYYYYE